ncbi:HAMP domain-containing histidine kinase [Staphylococcus pseudoxylosus]|uniref:HAMP domain-containing sensor histidine kinase n=1 Tax=Staphylococcus pseudoxylosus TaxID=2282419 RepID=UPI000D1D32E7|nr:HAMP domain-containing histidine kinase [Staphylococcus pseudoxylosus]PTI44486.1 two-component sensor histidine kinase [Staphylococcus xylosus]MEB6035792.1 HAMP domain-containing histidine kinase [Staphylococcus pseudoxylosus]MEB6059957.1 HAMP domain-containing histidine kinase [Staphylococcus pseudoxylosus]MEB7752700.1 HAMP domain-containing histidine kinase [Staphylococcus pseudoxylosus]MEB7763134.1 HAMP domain-containing histidine kinase [Staphylococcus pseudoxylosus]
MKQRKLKTKWMMITTTITFLTIFVFSLIIIFFLSSSLRHNELSEANRSSDDIVQLFESKNINHITPLDLNASLGNFQKVILFNDEEKKIIETSNDKSITFSPEVVPKDRNNIVIKKHQNTDYLIITDHIDSPKFKGYSVIVHSLEDYNALVNSLYFIALIFGVIATFITAIISYFFSSQITKPLILMSNKMQQIRRDGFQEKVELSTNYEETDNLIATFNEMMFQLEESFNQQRQFVEDASHELRTPLQIIQGHLNLINRWGKKDAAILEESLDISLEEMSRITKLVEELLLLTKENNNSRDGNIENVEINAEITSRIKSLKQLHEDYTFEFDAFPKPLNIKIDRYQLEQVLIIFIDNAMKYDQVNKHIHIQTKLRNKQTSIEITDHGVGIPKEDIEFIFDRFYRVDKSRSRKLGGNGLGLSIAKKIIELNHGKIQVDSVVGQYTTFKITF